MDLYSLLVRFEASSFYLALLIYFAWYPLVTSVMWIFTSIIFYRRREGGETDVYDAFYEADDQPLVSFVIPAFNEEANIAATLTGVLAVDYPNFEVVVIDDCSTDGTLAEIEPFLADPSGAPGAQEGQRGQGHGPERRHPPDPGRAAPRHGRRRRPRSRTSSTTWCPTSATRAAPR